MFCSFLGYSISSTIIIECVSNYVRNKLIEKLNIDIHRTEIEYDKVDKSRFNKNVETNYKNRIVHIVKTYNLKNKKVFLYVGRLATSKRIHLLIRMFKKEKRENPNSKLIIVGKPTFRGYFKKLLKMADEDIIFTGFVSDNELPTYYAVSDVYVTASSDEGFNLPAVEAQACGKPVVAFDIGSHSEVIDEKKCTLIPEGDTKGFANAMLKYAGSA